MNDTYITKSGHYAEPKSQGGEKEKTYTAFRYQAYGQGADNMRWLNDTVHIDSSELDFEEYLPYLGDISVEVAPPTKSYSFFAEGPISTSLPDKPITLQEMQNMVNTMEFSAKMASVIADKMGDSYVMNYYYRFNVSPLY